MEEAQTQTKVGRRLVEERSAKRAKEREQEENRDPWAYAPYFKTQQLEEDLGTAVCVAMTSDGKRFFSSAGPCDPGLVQAKKVRGGPKGPQFRCESIMQGHTKDVTCLKIAHSQLFSYGGGRFYKNMAVTRYGRVAKAVTLSMTAPCTSLCLLDTATEPRDMSGLHASRVYAILRFVFYLTLSNHNGSKAPSGTQNSP